MNLDGTPDEEDLEFYDRYGPWDALDPVDLQALMDGVPEPWWIVGGHAIDAFTGVTRARAPWIIDCPINPDIDGRWQSKRDGDHVADLDEVTWVDNRGIRFLNPEVVLHFKAAQNRGKDRFDLEIVWPLLSREKKLWLAEWVRKFDPEHPWSERLANP